MDFDRLSGTPSNITAPGRLLTPKDKWDGAANLANDVVRTFLNANAMLFRHDGSVLATGRSRITREDVTAHNGLRTMVWQQELDGIPVFESILKANLTRDNELITLGSHYLSDPKAATNKEDAARATLIAQPPVTVPQAVDVAAGHLGEVPGAEEARAISAPEGVEKRQRLTAPGLSDTTTSLTWLPTSEDSMRLAWDVTLMSTLLSTMFRMLVDAENGEVLLRRSLTSDISNATYRVYAKPAFQP